MKDIKYIEIIWTKVLAYMPTLVMGILTFIIGMFVVSILGNTFEKVLKKRSIDGTLQTFLSSLVKSLLKVMVILSVLGILGVKTTSFVAVLGALGLAIGLSLQGSLSNFAGGVLIILFKPFKTGDVIEAQGFIGSVNAINLFITKLKTGDNKVILIPNGPLANGPITNYSAESTRRVDLVFGIGYGDNLKKAKELIINTIAEDSRVLTEPKPFIAVSELADNSVNFTVRVWTKSEDYWGVHFDSIEKVKLVLDENNISIPFPQRDVYLHTTN